MYCGDETGGIVVDVGTATARFGFAGDDSPKSVFSSVVGVNADSGEVYTSAAARMLRPKVNLRSCFDYGIVTDWDALEQVWRTGFKQLSSNASEHPVIVADSAFSLAGQREKMLEMMFETFQTPAAYIARAPALAAFSMGRGTAVVVDIGASSTRVTPVYDGYVLQKSSYLSEVGGNFLSEVMQEMIKREHGVSAIHAHSTIRKLPPGSVPMPVDPRVRGGAAAADAGEVAAGGMEVEPPTAPASSASAATGASTSGSAGAGDGSVPAVQPLLLHRGRFDVVQKDMHGVTPSFLRYAALDVVDDIKRSVCTVHETGYDATVTVEAASYELPDGQVLSLSALRHSITELHFQVETKDFMRTIMEQHMTAGFKSLFHSGVNVRAARGGSSDSTPIPLQEAIHLALLGCTPETRRDMSNNILLTGGGANLPGLHKRLHWECLARIPAAFKPRIIAPAPVEREHAAWIGGSILASLGTFQQMWVSKQEYCDEGSSALERRSM